MKDLFRPLAKPLLAASIAVLLVGIAGCNEERGNGNNSGAANARLAEMQQKLSRAQQDTEKALTRNTVLQSRLKVLEAAAGTAAAAAPVATLVAETTEVQAIAEAPVAAAEPVAVPAAAPADNAELNAIKAQLTSTLEERDRLHALLEENEEALRDGLAASAQRQQLMTGMEEQLAATRQVAEAATARLELAEQQIKAMQGELSGGQKELKASVAQMASLQEQVVAIQSDKAALESRLAAQDQQLQSARGAADQASGKVVTLEQSLAAARAHGNTLAEQLAAIQADTQELETRLVESGNRLQAAEARAQTVVAEPVAEPVAAAGDDSGVAIAALKAQLVAAQDEDARLRDRANSAEQRGVDLEQQLSGALTQAKALQQEVAGLRHERDELEAEMQAAETVAVDAAVSVDSSALAVDDAVEIQALLEEGQTLLEACNASLGSGAEQMFELEQQSLGLRNALERQRRVTAMRCNHMSGALKAALRENRRLRAVMSGKLAR